MKRAVKFYLKIIYLMVFWLVFGSASHDKSVFVEKADLNFCSSKLNGQTQMKTKQMFKNKRKGKDNGVGTLVVGFLMSLISIALFIFSTGGSGFPLLFGLFGALLCMLALASGANRRVSIIGFGLGLIGGVGS